MIITTQDLTYIENVILTAKQLGIDNVIIEPNRVRGIDDSSSVILLHTDNVPALPFGSIGLNRIDIFSSRYAIAKTNDKLQLEVITAGADDAPYARSITMKGKGLKIDYRCANPATIRATKELKDVVTFSSYMTSDAVQHLQKGAAAMEADDVLLIGTNTSISLELVDINNDKLTFQFGDLVNNISDTPNKPISFTHKYPVKILQTIFKNNSTAEFFITSKGLLKTAVNGLDVFVIPKVA